MVGVAIPVIVQFSFLTVLFATASWIL
uniref:Uncharacterized protein n=1 Tax=Arundo donax TaxID=35708 RepID=A0A0A8YPT1_ARUDO